MKPRVIITTDMECDDMNSLIHLCLHFNEVQVEGIIYTASEFHFLGDGVHTLQKVNPHYLCMHGKPEAGVLKAYRPFEKGWIERLFDQEYRAVYRNLFKHDPDFPTPDYLLQITKYGNVEFEGDVREETEGSKLIESVLLDDVPGKVYLSSWGGFNTFARAFMSIAEKYQNTSAWNSVYRKVVQKAVLMGYSQDCSYLDYVRDVWPDLVTLQPNDGYASYFAKYNMPLDCRDLFKGEWMKEHIKYGHGPLLAKYGLMGDGTVYQGEPEDKQYGLTTTIDWHIPQFPPVTMDPYDCLGEGDTTNFMAVIPCGLRGLERGECGTWAGRITFEPAQVLNGSMQLASQTRVPEYNYMTGRREPSGQYVKWFHEEFAARADWCVKDFQECVHPPVIHLSQKDFTVSPGTSIALDAEVQDRNGYVLSYDWQVDRDACTYKGSAFLRVWDPLSLHTKFTVPCDAEPGDFFCITLTVRNRVETPITRFGQVFVYVRQA